MHIIVAVVVMPLLAALFAALLGLRNYRGGNLADALIKEADEKEEEALDPLIRREAEAAAMKLGVSQTQAESAIRQLWDEGKLKIRGGVLRLR
jgi:hypothetical protein